jgi:hypothetical protein
MISLTLIVESTTILAIIKMLNLRIIINIDFDDYIWMDVDILL